MRKSYRLKWNRKMSIASHRFCKTIMWQTKKVFIFSVVHRIVLQNFWQTQAHHFQYSQRSVYFCAMYIVKVVSMKYLDMEDGFSASTNIVEIGTFESGMQIFRPARRKSLWDVKWVKCGCWSTRMMLSQGWRILVQRFLHLLIKCSRWVRTTRRWARVIVI